jgi:(p)ppGpp synthase/HD superfamily hydrolase
MNNTYTHNIFITATVAFIQEAHAGQKYGNMPYFFHPVEVAETVQLILNTSVFAGPVASEFINRETDDAVVAALLHDVIEDTEYTETQLRERFTSEAVEMVLLCTKDETLDYRQNIQRIVDSNDIGAMIVKLADNTVNLNGDKSAMAQARADKLNERYTMSIEMLKAALVTQGVYVT